MNPTAGDEYLRNAVLTATPEQLQMMLYDGAIRFASQAREAIEAKDIEQTHNFLTRAQRILVEMQNGLRPEVDPQLCDQVASLYSFVYRKLIDANVNKDLKALDEAVRILKHMRETWAMLLDRLRQERASGAAGGVQAESVGAAEEPGQFSVEG